MDIKYFDSHAHYTDSRFGAEYPGGVDALLERLFGGCVCGVINVGTDIPSSEQCCAMARRYGKMYAAAGIHPSDTRFYPDCAEQLGALRGLLGRAAENKIVAVGEIGYDYHYEDTDRARQREYLIPQLELAREFGLPAVIHDRDAHGDCLEAVRSVPGARGVFHSFSGSAETARELVRLGWYISFTGVVTFKNAGRLAQVAASVPRERLLVETDAPYLAPVPFRGQLNHSGMLEYTVAAIAQIRGETPEAVAQYTAQNAGALFGIPV